MEPGSIWTHAVAAQSMKQLPKDDARFTNEQPYSLQLEKALQRAPAPAPLPDVFGARATVLVILAKVLVNCLPPASPPLFCKWP